jgi:hypothetical protein
LTNYYLLFLKRTKGLDTVSDLLGYTKFGLQPRPERDGISEAARNTCHQAFMMPSYAVAAREYGAFGDPRVDEVVRRFLLHLMHDDGAVPERMVSQIGEWSIVVGSTGGLFDFGDGKQAR